MISKVLVIGSNGQLGQCLKESLPHKNLDIFFSSKEEIDITKHNLCKKKIKEIKPDIVINCSGYTHVDDSEKNKNLANIINDEAVSNIASICKEIDSRFIHISTDYVFDGTAFSPYSENDITKPISAYGISKLNGEISIKKSKCKYFIIRTSWAFSDYGDNFLKTMLKHGASNDEIYVVNDQIGCPTYMRDLAETIKVLILKDGFLELSSQVLHYSGDEECSWFEFAKEIFKHASLSGLKIPNKIHPVSSSYFNAPASRPSYSSLDCSKISKLFGVEPSDWKSGLQDAIKRISSK